MATHVSIPSYDQRHLGWVYPVTGVIVLVLLCTTLQLPFRSLRLSHNSSCSSCCLGGNLTVLKLQYTNTNEQQQQNKEHINTTITVQQLQQQQQQGSASAGDQHLGEIKHDAASSQEYCSVQFPWIENVVKEWFKPSYGSAKESQQNSSTALQSIKDVRWGEYHPGMEEVTLKYNTETERWFNYHIADWEVGTEFVTPGGNIALSWCRNQRSQMDLGCVVSCVSSVFAPCTTAGTDMSVNRVSKPNQPWKPLGMLAILQRAVATHNGALAAALKDTPTREVRLIIETEDFPLVHRSSKWKLPAFAMCASPDHIDIPVPDFTFEEYPEAGYTNSSWSQLSELLRMKGKLVPWKLKQENLFMRQNKGVGYRKTLMPVLERLQANGKDAEVLGVSLDIADTGFMVSQRQKFVLLDDWCNHRYQLHTSGFSYSASLKYKMACGAVVFNFMSPKWREFYYPALQNGEQFINFNETDAAGLNNVTLPQIKQHIDKYQSGGDAEPQVAANARDWVKHHLSSEGLSCYWYRVLLHYIKLYAAEGPDGVPDL